MHKPAEDDADKNKRTRRNSHLPFKAGRLTWGPSHRQAGRNPGECSALHHSYSRMPGGSKFICSEYRPGVGATNETYRLISKNDFGFEQHFRFQLIERRAAGLRNMPGGKLRRRPHIKQCQRRANRQLLLKISRGNEKMRSTHGK